MLCFEVHSRPRRTVHSVGTNRQLEETQPFSKKEMVTYDN
jgi:hypothetical protein